jgi:predicted ATPase/transcriptional regulator with XRE-family HTH domain
METTHSFGYWVRRRRKVLDLTQRELAGRAACSVSAVKKIEADMRRPSRQLAETLADALAIPEEERALFLRVARGRAPVDEMPVSGRPQAPATGGPGAAQLTAGNLPLGVSPIFGREEEVDQLIQHISSASPRLITLVGPGGVGKSTLALEAARQCHDQFQDGAWLVPLAGVEDPAYLSTAIAMALGLNFAGPLDPRQQLVRQLAGRRLLLILDNLEQLLPEAAELVHSLIHSLPELTMLVTSRERQRLQAELTVPVNGLAIEPARTLFLERAERSGARLVPDRAEDTAAAIDRICLLVAGLPLAIELAAAWARLLPPGEILAELERSHELLASDLQDLPERHRSVQALFDASWLRLTADDQRLLANLSVFAGSFSREAAEVVCGASLAQLATLHDHSLIQRDAERFHLHPLIRQLAAEKLARMPDDLAMVQARHAGYYADFLARLSDLFKRGGPQLAGWELAVDGNIDNIRVAWQWMMIKDQPQRLLPATLALYLYQDFRGQVLEGAQMSAALAQCAAKLRADRGGDEAILRRTQAMALLAQGAMGIRAGQIGRGKEQLEQAYALLAGLEAADERIALIGLLGPVAMLTMDRETGQEFIEETLVLARREGHAWGWPLALNFLGLFHFAHGRMGEARDNLSAALTLWQEQPGLAWCKLRTMVHLGLVYHALGDYETAQSIQVDALNLAREVKDYSFIPLSQCNLALHYYARRELGLAKESFASALTEAQRFGLLPSVGHSIMGLGLVAAAEGLASRAVTLFAFAARLPGSYTAFLLGEPQHALTRLRVDLPAADFAAAEERARQMDLAALIAWL